MRRSIMRCDLAEEMTAGFLLQCRSVWMVGARRDRWADVAPTLEMRSVRYVAILPPAADPAERYVLAFCCPWPEGLDPTHLKLWHRGDDAAAAWLGALAYEPDAPIVACRLWTLLIGDVQRALLPPG